MYDKILRVIRLPAVSFRVLSDYVEFHLAYYPNSSDFIPRIIRLRRISFRVFGNNAQIIQNIRSKFFCINNI
jgi:hypothetical protein